MSGLSRLAVAVTQENDGGMDELEKNLKDPDICEKYPAKKKAKKGY